MYNIYVRKRTVKIKLNPTPPDKLIIQQTLDACNKAMNWISEMAWQKKCFNRVALHHLLYYELRDRFNLPSQIAIALKDKICASYKADNKKKHSFKAKAFPLNFPRTAKLVSETVISFNTIKGRLRVFMILGDFQKQYLRDKSWRIRESEIVYSNHKYFLHLVVQRDEPEETKADKPVGVDLGINRSATPSNKAKLRIKNFKSVRNHYRQVRKQLQSKGTRGAKRPLRRLSGKEKRLCKHINHIISRDLVDSLRNGEYFVFENLKGIRQRVRLAKKQRRNLHSWSFGQLIGFSTYKAKAKGIPVLFEDAKNSSRECSRCGHISKSNRMSQSLFRCVSCGFQHNADLNASINLAKRAGSIGLGNCQFALKSLQVSGSDKPATLVVGV